jgi:hypothetical protein
MATRVTGPGPAQMKLLAVKLHQADPELRRDLRRQFRAIAAPTVADVRASILSMPSHHDGTLRGEIARTVSSSVGATRSGVRLDIVSSGRKMPPGKGELPRDTNAAKWNHPVFARPMAELIAHMTAGFSPKPRSGHAPSRQHGRGWTWVKQTGKPHWFETAVSKNAPRARAAVLDAMSQTARRLG